MTTSTTSHRFPKCWPRSCNGSFSLSHTWPIAWGKVIFCLSKQIIHQFVLLWHISIDEKVTGRLCSRLSWTHFPICYIVSNIQTHRMIEANVPLGVKLIKSLNNVHLSSSPGATRKLNRMLEISHSQELYCSQVNGEQSFKNHGIE